MIQLKVSQIGNSFGVILPKEAMQRLNIARGDAVFLTESPNGYEISAYDPEFEDDMARGEKYAKKYRNALRELAK